MIPVFIGYDTREVVAYHVLSASIIRHARRPVSISPIGNSTLPRDLWWREKGPHDSTEFSNARFAIPALCGFQGWSIFMDCDMVCLDDIEKLWAQRDARYAVQVVKHDHRPQESRKFLGAEQATYHRKNWSSLMLLNHEHPATRALTPEFVNIARGLDLHGFAWAAEEEIGEIRGLWNVLASERGYEHPGPVIEPDVKLLHYTLGGPWHGYEPQGTEAWLVALRDLLSTDNPRSTAFAYVAYPGMIRLAARYYQEPD